MVRLLIMNAKDHVAVAAEPLSAGEYGSGMLNGEEIKVQALSDIPKYHKIAIRPAKKGEDVIRYGEVIGHALSDIEVGEHVHTQNISDMRRDGE